MNLKNNWRQESLETLENKNWGDPAEAPTTLVKRCIELTKAPIFSFTLSDIRVMIGQQIGLSYLIPLALEKLQKDVFIETDFYEGDLISNILNIDSAFWNDHKNYWAELNDLISDKRQHLSDLKISTTKFDDAKS